MLKKLLTLVAATAAFSANAEVIWSGSAPLDWNNGKALEIEAAALAGAQAGDVITVNFTMDPSASYANMFFCVNVDGWPHMTNNASRTNVSSYNSYNPGTTNSSCTIAAADITTGLTTDGLALMGEKLTVTSVELVSAADAPAENVWIGDENLGNWGNIEVPTSYTKNLKAGDAIDVYFTVGTMDTYGKMEFKAGWDINLNASCSNVNEYGAFEPDVTFTTFTVSAQNVADILANGFIVSGYNVRVTKIVFGGDGSGNQGGGNTGGETGGKTYTWTGNVTSGANSWSNVELKAKDIAFIEPGMPIVIEFTVNAGEDWAQFVLKDDTDWAEVPGLKATATNLDSYGCFQAGTTSTTITPDASNAAILASKGLAISFERMTVTKVVVNPSPTGIESIVTAENAPVEYYNLQGVRVNNPSNGIFIRRQGNVVTKVRF